MQAPTNSLGRAATTPQAGPASDCIVISRSGTSRRYRLRSPITRQARSLGVTDGAAALAGVRGKMDGGPLNRSEEHTSELQSQSNLVCRLLLEKKKKKQLVSYSSYTMIQCSTT